ncbi:MAG: hypothetical protein Q4B01_10130, partial [Eubacteriales bacterium]|nr:hypothetical protein [Eubacteriales bacterium]
PMDRFFIKCATSFYNRRKKINFNYTYYKKNPTVITVKKNGNKWVKSGKGVKYTDGRSDETSFIFNKKGQLIEERTNGRTIISYKYDKKGFRILESSESGNYESTYDKYGNQLKYTLIGATENPSINYKNTYDKHGKLIKTVSPAGPKTLTVLYTYKKIKVPAKDVKTVNAHQSYIIRGF